MGFNIFGTLTLLRKIGGGVLIDAENVFNKINQIGMLWTVFHVWQSGDRFF